MNEWAVPEDLRYDTNDYWVRFGGAAAIGGGSSGPPAEGALVTVGLTDYGQDVVGDILYLDPPPVGRSLVRGVECGSLESGKWAGMLLAPVSGVVHRVNPKLVESLRVIADDPYGEGWLLEISLGPTGPAEYGTLLTPAEYRASIAAREAGE